MRAKELEGQRALLLELLGSSYDRFAWHGPNLTQALAGVKLAQAAWRPADDVAAWNIHEITLHVADVMQRCSAQLFGAVLLRVVDRGAFPLAAGPGEAEWIAALEFLRRSWTHLDDGLKTLPASALSEESPSNAYGRRWTIGEHLQGIALHNTYHAAQIVSLRKRQGAWTEL